MSKLATIAYAVLGLIASPVLADTPVFPPAGAPSDPATIKLYQEVATADAGVGRAIFTKNYAALDQFWAPGFVVNGPGNKVLSRAQVIQAIASGKLEYRDYHVVVEAISEIGDNVVEMGHEDYVPVTGPETGKKLYRRFTQVLARHDGRLLFIARQATIYDPSAIHY